MFPTITPTILSPTRAPSIASTSTPTTVPSASPSSLLPTSMMPTSTTPTQQPTTTPSTHTPTTITATPTIVPTTRAPSRSITTITPSILPSYSPTVISATTPSFKPVGSKLPTGIPTGIPTVKPTNSVDTKANNLLSYLNSLPLMIQLAIWIPLAIVSVIVCILLSKCYNWQRKPNSKKLSYRRDISIITTSLDDIIKQHKKLQNDWYGNTEETTSTDETIDSWDYNEANELSAGSLLEGDFDYVNSFKTLDSRDSVYYLENPLNFVCSITSDTNTVDIENPAPDASYDIDNNSESDDSHSRNTDASNGHSEDSKFYYSTDVFNSKFSRCEDSGIALV